MNIEEIVQYYPTCKVTNFKKGKNTMKKSISIILAVLMIASCIPMFASAATITLSSSNVEIIPPTVTPAEVKYGEGYANAVATGGQLWYIDENGNKTEVKGYFDIRNKATNNPIYTGPTSLQLLFYPEDTATYGEVSSSLSEYGTTLVSGEWPTIYIRGTYTEIVTPPTFTCDAGDSLALYTNYTKTGGKVVNASGTNVTSSGQFYIADSNVGDKNQYLYEDTYVTAEWKSKSKTGYENAYYENVLVKVTRKNATLATAPAIPAVLTGTTIGQAMAKLTAKVTLTGNKTSNDTTNKFWTPVYPEGMNADTPITAPITLTVKYENPATDDTFTAEVPIDVYYKPFAVISEKPTADATALKPGMTAGEIVLNGGVALREESETVVSGTFSVKDPSTVLKTGNNTIEIIFTPADTEAYEGTSTTIRVRLTSLITTAPTLDATGLDAGDKVSQIKLTGGEAKEEGTFSFENPDQILVAGTNRINVKFTPSAEGVTYYEIKTISLTIQSEYKFLDKDGNETVPVYTVTYGTALKDSNVNINALIGQTGCYLNATSNYSYSAPDGKDAIISNSFSGITLPVGEHTFEVTVKPIGYSITETPPYITSTLTFVINVVPVEMNVLSVDHNALENELKVRVDNTAAEGTYDVFVDGVQIADNVSGTSYGMDEWLTVEIPWAVAEKINKEYTVKVVYNPIENEPVAMEDYEGTFRTNLPFTVYKDGSFTMYQGKNQVTGGSYSPAYEGITRIQCTVPYEQQADFITWYITDEDGNELDIEVYGIEKTHGTGTQTGTLVETKVEAELSDTTIYFDMPNGNVKVSYKTQSMIDEEAKQEAIDNCNCLCHYTNPVAEFIWKIISFFMNLFGIDKPCACGFAHEVK